MRLSDEEIRIRIGEFPGWKYQGNSVVKQFEFEDFGQAVDFVAKIVPIAEGMNHHPDIEIKNVSHVVVSLTTHDEKGVTDLDFDLAGRIEQLTGGPGLTEIKF